MGCIKTSPVKLCTRWWIHDQMFVCLIAGAVCTSCIPVTASLKPLIPHTPSPFLLPRLCVCLAQWEISASQIHTAADGRWFMLRQPTGAGQPCAYSVVRNTSFMSFSTRGISLRIWHSKYQLYGPIFTASLLQRNEKKNALFYSVLWDRERRKTLQSLLRIKMILQLAIRPLHF